MSSTYCLKKLHVKGVELLQRSPMETSPPMETSLMEIAVALNAFAPYRTNRSRYTLRLMSSPPVTDRMDAYFLYTMRLGEEEYRGRKILYTKNHIFCPFSYMFIPTRIELENELFFVHFSLSSRRKKKLFLVAGKRSRNAYDPEKEVEERKAKHRLRMEGRKTGIASFGIKAMKEALMGVD